METANMNPAAVTAAAVAGAPAVAEAAPSGTAPLEKIPLTAFDYNVELQSDDARSVTATALYGSNPIEAQRRQHFSSIGAFAKKLQSLAAPSGDGAKPFAFTLYTNGWNPEDEALAAIGPVTIAIVSRPQQHNAIYAYLRPSDEELATGDNAKTLVRAGVATALETVTRLVRNVEKRDPGALAAFDFAPENLLALPSLMVTSRGASGVVVLRATAKALFNHLLAEIKAKDEANKAAGKNRLTNLIAFLQGRDKAVKDMPLHWLSSSEAFPKIAGASVVPGLVVELDRAFMNYANAMLRGASDSGQIHIGSNAKTKEPVYVDAEPLRRALEERASTTYETPLLDVSIGL